MGSSILILKCVLTSVINVIVTVGKIESKLKQNSRVRKKT
jgi:hypothetical protein